MTKILAWLLAAAVAIIALLGWAYLGQRDKAVTHDVREQQATGVALKCSEGTESLALQARQREVDAAPKRRQAQEAAAQHNRESDRILAEPPAVPGNVCASAQAELDDWWQRRAKP